MCIRDRPNLLLAQVHTDAGLVGLGETSRGAAAVEAQLHELTAPYLLGKDPLQIQAHNRHLMNSYLGFASSSTEVRAASAVDIALWDIFGQALNRPIAQLLGGYSRDRIRAYNTCAGYNYNTRTVARRSVTTADASTRAEGPYDDQVAFVFGPARLNFKSRVGNLVQVQLQLRNCPLLRRCGSRLLNDRTTSFSATCQHHLRSPRRYQKKEPRRNTRALLKSSHTERLKQS